MCSGRAVGLSTTEGGSQPDSTAAPANVAWRAQWVNAGDTEGHLLYCLQENEKGAFADFKGASEFNSGVYPGNLYSKSSSASGEPPLKDRLRTPRACTLQVTETRAQKLPVPVAPRPRGASLSPLASGAKAPHGPPACDKQGTSPFLSVAAVHACPDTVSEGSAAGPGGAAARPSHRDRTQPSMHIMS